MGKFFSNNAILIHCNVLPSICCGKAYDGATNMSGHDFAARFKQDSPTAIHYLSCTLRLCDFLPLNSWLRRYRYITTQKVVAFPQSSTQRQKSDHTFDELYKKVIEDLQDLTDASVLPRQ